MRPIDRLLKRTVLNWDPALSLMDRFWRVVHEVPKSLAIEEKGDHVSYEELARRLVAIGRELERLALPLGEMVAVVTDRVLPRISAMFGAWHAGLAVLPMDSGLPVFRGRQILTQAGVRCLMHDDSAAAESWVELAKSLGMSTRLLSDLPSPVDADCLPTMSPVCRPEHRCIATFTSGSFGEPKGVAHQYRAILLGVAGFIERCRIGPDDRLTMLFPPTSGQAVNDQCAALLTGASLHVWDARRRGVHDFMDWLTSHRITVLHCVPTFLRALLTSTQSDSQLSDLRLINLSGEPACRGDLHSVWKRLNRECIVANSYGMSETKLVSLGTFDVESALDYEVVAVGAELPDTTVHLLCPDGTEVRPGEAGRIVVESQRLPNGYLGPDGIEAERWTTVDPQSNLRRFDTGDLGRRLPDGQLEHLGREDDQVKIRGFRVELPEVEAILRTHTSVREAAVVSIPGTSGRMQLAAGVVVENGLDTEVGDSVPELREFLLDRLPDYMVPAVIHQLPCLPLNSHGKVDRRLVQNQVRSEIQRTEAHEPETLEQALFLQIVEDVVGGAGWSLEDSFVAIGGDSLSAVGLRVHVARQWGVELELKEILRAPSLRQTADLIASRCSRDQPG